MAEKEQARSSPVGSLQKAALSCLVSLMPDWLMSLIRWPSWSFLFGMLMKSSDAVFPDHPKLNGKVVLITGASSGLGEALAHKFYESGCRLILCSRRRNELERVKQDLLKSYHIAPIYPPVVLPLNLEDVAKVTEIAESAKQIYGFIDILVNNGGVSYRGSIEKTSIDVDMRIMAINYFGQVALTKAIVKDMIASGKGGHIVNVGSVQGRISIPMRSAYAASKHALQAFSDCLRSEVNQHNIKISMINPGYIKTNLSLNALTGTGDIYGEMDQTTENGLPSDVVASRILHAIINEEKEVTIATLTPRLAILIRTLLPFLYFWLMSNRASRMLRQEARLSRFRDERKSKVS